MTYQKYLWKSICIIVLMLSSFVATAQTDLDSIKMIEEASGKDTYKSTEEDYFTKRDMNVPFMDTVEVRQISGNRVKELQQDEAFWYANASLKKNKPADKEELKTPFFQRTWFQALLWLVIIAGFAIFLLMYLSGSNINLFRRKNVRINKEGNDEELINEDIFAINYQKEIDKATRQGDYRLATRLRFLLILKNLSEKNIIQYKPGRTNFDYLQQLQATQYYPDFFRITRNYEYSWYGQFEVSENSYSIIKKDFESFEKKLNY
jgi:hypothetical protein